MLNRECEEKDKNKRCEGKRERKRLCFRTSVASMGCNLEASLMIKGLTDGLWPASHTGVSPQKQQVQAQNDERRAWELPHSKESGKMYRDKMYICHKRGFYYIQESQAQKLEASLNIKPI